ncbi:hypothetical protein JOD43_000213 [Pullulanibacillus pueri]|uniref:UPF0180 protein GCM10007096_02060 n=1 Tax=Pullulanibacillus pueri TaxID=1437324 RepID=A0A8J2ZR90_9BACL|nr:YkuS family protein [Pullulanibacillus pueri]MBM7680054.1 hypothetical protein [Pullulanibacillus pueri]GGH74133.1 UPF0180 protein YkuS [Pullulanibacillus pueri]
MAKIAVEETLTDVQQALEEKGYQVVPFRQEADAKDCDCCVISGVDENVMGVQDIVTEAPVIDCRGMDANQVCEEVEHRLSR